MVIIIAVTSFLLTGCVDIVEEANAQAQDIAQSASLYSSDETFRDVADLFAGVAHDKFFEPLTISEIITGLNSLTEMYTPYSIIEGTSPSSILANGHNNIINRFGDGYRWSSFQWSRTFTGWVGLSGRGELQHRNIVYDEIPYSVSYWPDGGHSMWWVENGNAFWASFSAGFTEEERFAFARARAVEHWTLHGNAVSASIQGFADVQVSAVNPLGRSAGAFEIIDGNIIHGDEIIGYRWNISPGRYQYVLAPGEYSFTAIGGSGELDLVVRHFEGGEIVSEEQFNVDGSFSLGVTTNPSETVVEELNLGEGFTTRVYQEDWRDRIIVWFFVDGDNYEVPLADMEMIVDGQQVEVRDFVGNVAPHQNQIKAIQILRELGWSEMTFTVRGIEHSFTNDWQDPGNNVSGFTTRVYQEDWRDRIIVWFFMDGDNYEVPLADMEMIVDGQQVDVRDYVGNVAPHQNQIQAIQILRELDWQEMTLRVTVQGQTIQHDFVNNRHVP